MNQKAKGMFDRFLLALGSVALMPPTAAMPITVLGDRIVIARNARRSPEGSGPDIEKTRARVRWAT